MKHIILPVVAMTLVISLHGQAVKETDLTPQEKATFNSLKGRVNAAPSVKQASEKLRIAKVDGITKLDPSLKPLAEKILPPPPVNPNDLPADEKNKWKKVDADISKDPAVVKATNELQQARVDIMLKLNPAVKPILQKLYPTASFPADAPAAAGAPAAPAAPEPTDGAQ